VDESLLPIGQFANLVCLSPKALRLYQAQGVLAPVAIDERSGYRYYAPAQIPVARRIGLLRRAGISLADIAVFLESPTAHQVEGWIRDLEVEVAERRQLLHDARHHAPGRRRVGREVGAEDDDLHDRSAA